MCGIAGLVDWSGRAVDRSLLETMTRRLVHRGPDGEGYHLHGNVGLGHRRLSIIDLGHGAQPMCNEDGSIWVTYNGEIYNFPELKKDLESRGHIFRSVCDTEVLVHAYEEWGDSLVEQLRGMFAFAILDQVKERLLLARDRFGVKPLVYYSGERWFAFASETKAIAAHPDIPREIDYTGLAHYFEYGYVPAPETIFKDIRKLPPGQIMSVDLKRPGKIQEKRYWFLDYSAQIDIDENSAIQRLDEILSDAIRIRMISDVPLGGLLSGGLDSSAVVTLMARQSTDPVKTFSIGFEDERFTETSYARIVADQNGTDHTEYTVKPDIQDILPKLVYHFDEPFSDASAIPTYYLCKMAREKVTVCLSGDGGDEVFAGYERYLHCSRLGRFDWLPLSFRRAVFGAVGKLYPRVLPGAGFFTGLSRTAEERFLNYMAGQYGSIDRGMLYPEQVRRKVDSIGQPFEYLTNSFDDGIKDVLHKYLDVDIKTYLPNDILAKVDITSMMNSLEVREPLLDHKLVEFVAKLPSGLKLRHGQGKYILKQVMTSRLPARIIYRKKMGFGVPMRSWVANELRDVTHEYLLNRSKASGLLNGDLLEKMVMENEKKLYGSKIAGKLYWALFFEMWYRDVFSSDGLGFHE